MGYNINGPDVDSSGFGTYQPVGDLIVDFGSPVEKGSFIRELSLDKGLVESHGIRNGNLITSTAFCSHPDQVIVIHYTSEKKQRLNFSISYAIQRKYDSVDTAGNAILLSCNLKNGIQCLAKAIVINEGGTLGKRDKEFVLHNATSCTILVAIETNYVMDFGKDWKGELPETKIEKMFKGLRGLACQQLYDRHEKDYRTLYNRTSLYLGKSDNKVRSMPTYARLAAYREKAMTQNWKSYCLIWAGI